jgi:hypothetical protein
LDNRKCKHTFGFLTLCPCCTNFLGKTVHLVAWQAFKTPDDLTAEIFLNVTTGKSQSNMTHLLLHSLQFLHLKSKHLLYIVTRQPIVGLRNRGYATRFQASAGKQGFRTDAMTSCNSVGIWFRAATMTSHATGLAEYHVTCFLRVRSLRNTKKAALPLVRLRVYKRSWNA